MRIHLAPFGTTQDQPLVVAAESFVGDGSQDLDPPGPFIERIYIQASFRTLGYDESRFGGSGKTFSQGCRYAESSLCINGEIEGADET